MAGTWPLNDSPASQEKNNVTEYSKELVNAEEEIYDPESANFSPEEEQTTSSINDPKLSMSAKMARINQQIEKEKAEIAIVKSKVKDSKSLQSSSINEREKRQNRTINVAGFQGLPTGIASILFGETSSSNVGGNEIPGLGDISEDIGDIDSSIKDSRKTQVKSPIVDSSQSTSLSRLSDVELLEKAAAQMPTSNKTLDIHVINPQTKFSGAKQSQYVLTSESKPSEMSRQIIEKNMWEQNEFDSYYGVSKRHTTVDNEASPWAASSVHRGTVEGQHRDSTMHHSNFHTANKEVSDWNRPSRHGFRSGDSHRNYGDDYDYNYSGHRRTWQSHSKDSSKYNYHGQHFEERERKDSNSWRDRDMRRENNREYSGRYTSRERDHDFRIDRHTSHSRHRSPSRSKSKDDNLKPPGEEERNYDKAFNRSTACGSRSRSPIDKRNNFEPMGDSTSTQSLDERIANVVNRLPN